MRPAKIKRDMPVLNNNTAIYNYVCKNWDDKKAHIESAYVAYIDHSHKLIEFELLSTGDATSCSVPITAMMRRAVVLNAYGIVFAHNHPNDTTSPSEADLNVTEMIYRDCKALDIVLLDHIIVSTKCGPYSFKERGTLDKYENRLTKTKDLYKSGTFLNTAVSIVEKFCEQAKKYGIDDHAKNVVQQQLDKVFIKYFDPIIN
jgi:hypothetical protein